MEHRGFHLFISPPVGFLFCGHGACATTSPSSEQGLCQAHNKLIFLAFSASLQVCSDPHRSTLDGVTVPRRNTSRTATAITEEFGFLII
jgi:hypothetical protein